MKSFIVNILTASAIASCLPSCSPEAKKQWSEIALKSLNSALVAGVTTGATEYISYESRPKPLPAYTGTK